MKFTNFGLYVIRHSTSALFSQGKERSKVERWKLALQGEILGARLGRHYSEGKARWWKINENAMYKQ
jgi:hypothetical protein